MADTLAVDRSRLPAMRFAFLLPLLLVACQSTPRSQRPNGVPAQLTLEVHAGFDAVWVAVIETFATSTIAIETIEKASGFVAAAQPIDFAGVPDLVTLVDLGTLNGVWAASRVQAQPGQSSVRVRYNVFVHQGDTRQLLRVNSTWTGSIAVQGVNSGGAIVPYQVALTGNSKGVFERRLLEMIADKLPGASSTILETQPFRLSTFATPPREFGTQSDDDGWTRMGSE
jgi:hypothetical protein